MWLSMLLRAHLSTYKAPVVCPVRHTSTAKHLPDVVSAMPLSVVCSYWAVG